MNHYSRMGWMAALAAGVALAAWQAGCGRGSLGGPPSAPAHGRSPQSAAVAAHLEYGGELYLLVDAKGELEPLGNYYADTFGPLLGMFGPSGPANLRDQFKRLGFYGIEGAGMSAWRAPDSVLYHNRGFLYVPGGRTGLLKVLGGPAAPFVTPQLAPADADLVFETTLDFKTLAELIFAYVNDFQGAAAVADLRNSLKQPVAPGVPVTWQDLLDRGDTRLTVVGRLDAGRTLAFGGPVNPPRLELLIGIDGLGELYPTLEPLLRQPEVATMITAGDKGGMKTATWEFELPPPWTGYKPLVIADPKSKRLYFVSSPGFADATVFGGGARLAGAADFREATAGLPTKGNSLAYLSRNGVAEGVKFYQGMLALATPTGGPAPTNPWFEAYGKTPHGIASISANLPEGVFTQSNWPDSGKSVLTSVPMLGAAFVFAAGYPMYTSFVMRGAPAGFSPLGVAPAVTVPEEAAVRNNLRQLASAAMQYMLDKGVTSVRYADLIAGPQPYLRALTPVAGESYADLVVRQQDAQLSVRLADGRQVTFDL